VLWIASLIVLTAPVAFNRQKSRFLFFAVPTFILIISVIVGIFSGTFGPFGRNSTHTHTHFFLCLCLLRLHIHLDTKPILISYFRLSLLAVGMVYYTVLYNVYVSVLLWGFGPTEIRFKASNPSETTRILFDERKETTK
jgi:hypothetical protein